MKIVVIGGSGLIGRQVVADLREVGHEAASASPRSGVDTVTGAGLAAALAGAQVVVDVSNSPSFADDDVLEFFTKSTTNLTAAAAAAGVGHFVALSVVGADRLPDSGYMRAKWKQEQLIASGRVPYTIVRATQFFEFVDAIAGSGTSDGEIRLPPAKMQPIAAEDVAAAVTFAAVGKPVNGIIDVAGPEPIGMDDLVRRYFNAKHDGRRVTTDPAARYFGALIDDRSLRPEGKPRLGSVRYDAWLSKLGN
ncbi:MAG: SDR family oxidoreductase [Planctomycetaceae bacterium]|nr:SDR family oxidoreductase [Planctomycetaceae bacterium]